MLARIWRGVVRAEDAAPYFEYLQRTGLAEYCATPGNLGVLALRRVIDRGVEFVLVTLWASVDAVREFAGDDIDSAVFYPEDERFLLEFDRRLVRFNAVFQSTPVRERWPARASPTDLAAGIQPHAPRAVVSVPNWQQHGLEAAVGGVTYCCKGRA